MCDLTLGAKVRHDLLPVSRKHPEINAAIREAFEESGLSKPEVARQLYDDAERWREFDRYLRTTTPGASIAIELARIFDKPVGSFIRSEPIHALAAELREAQEVRLSLDRRLESISDEVTRGVALTREVLEQLADDIAALARRLPPEAQQKQGTG